MKADIDKQGRLLLQPETDTEDRVLMRWFLRLSLEQRHVMHAVMKPWSFTPPRESSSYVLNVPQGLVQGPGHSDPVMTATEARTGLAALCNAAAEKHEAAMVAGWKRLIDGLAAVSRGAK